MIGVGGLGHMAVQLLRALAPARIVAVDTAADKLELARSVGADEAVQAGEQAAAEIAEATRGRGGRLVLDLVGSDDTMALAAAVAAPEADIAVVGLAGGTLPFRFGAAAWEASVSIP
ncbi:MAG TPA: zinc-binding dehydrogenase [Gaiellaceae bacterium]